MARVETYGGRKETLRQDGTRNLEAGFDAQSLGAGIGQAAQGLAQGIGDVAGAVQLAEDMEDKAVVDAQVNAYSDYMRERVYAPDTGYLTLSGQAAVTARAQFETDVDETRKKMGAGLTPKQQALYDRATDARRRQGLDTAIRHATGERKAWLNSASEARISTLGNDALAMSGEPDKFTVNMAAGIAEITDLGVRNGWPPELAEQKRMQFASSVHRNVAAKYAPNDPLRAKAWIDAHQDQMTGEDYTRMDSALAQPVLMAQAVQIADDLTEQIVRPPLVNATGQVDAARRQGPAAADSGTVYGRLQERLGDVLVLDGDAPQGAVELDVRGMTATERESVVMAAVDAGYTGIGFGAGKITLDQGEQRMWAEGGKLPAYASQLEGFANAAEQPDGQAGPAYVYDQVAGIKNPLLRRAAADEILRRQSAQDAQVRRQDRAAKIAAEKFIVANPGTDPRRMPLAQQMALGLDGMNAMISYYDRTKAGTVAIETDEVLYAGLERMAAEDPLGFAREVDLFDHINSLSTQDRRRLQTMQAAALGADRQSKEKAAAAGPGYEHEAKSLSTAMNIADDALRAAGIRKTGKQANNESRTAEARFQRALVDRFREFQDQNGGRPPNDYEVRDMVDELLLPVVFEKPNVVLPRFIGGGVGERKGRVFEAKFRKDTETVRLEMPYDDIPVDARLAIREELAIDLGREPTKDEVMAEYSDKFLAP